MNEQDIQNELASLRPEELEEMEALLGGGAPPINKGKSDLMAFFNKIVSTTDTLKVGNLDPNTELSPVRLLRDASLFAKVMNHDLIREYFHGKAEIVLGASLSKSGFLIEEAVTTKKESTIGQKQQRKVNSGWFKSKETQA